MSCITLTPGGAVVTVGASQLWKNNIYFIPWVARLSMSLFKVAAVFFTITDEIF